MACADMADEWNEIESVGKSLAHSNISEKCENGNNDEEKDASKDEKNVVAGNRNDATPKADNNRSRGSRGRGGGRGGYVNGGQRTPRNDKDNKKDEDNNSDKGDVKKEGRPQNNRNSGPRRSDDHKQGGYDNNRRKDGEFNRNHGDKNRDNKPRNYDNRQKDGQDNRNKDGHHENRARDGHDNRQRDGHDNRNKHGHVNRNKDGYDNRNKDGHDNRNKDNPKRDNNRRSDGKHENHSGKEGGHHVRGGNRHHNPHHKKSDGEKHEDYIPPAPTEDENEIYTTGIKSGSNFDKYNDIPVHVTGEDTPAVIENFQNSNLSQFILSNIEKSNYTIPTPIQKAAIPCILRNRDLMACAQTGSGKTAAFLLPIIDRVYNEKIECVVGKPQVLIVTPTRELAIQIYNETRKFSLKSFIKTCIVYGGVAAGYQSDNLENGCHILVATPGRLLDFVEREKVSFSEIRIVVLDEADCMLNMGFLPSVEKIMTHKSMTEQTKRQTLMFSATFPEDIQRLAGQYLNRYIFIAVGIVGGACADVEQNIFEVAKFDKRKKLMEILTENDPNGTMIFVEQKKNADFLASFVSETKIPTTSIHGDRLQREREEALNDFKSGRMKLLIATSVAARGLDIKNVKHVINYDLPNAIDAYIHRIGRTGRIGNCGRATSFYDPNVDGAIAADLKKILMQADQPVPDFLQNPIIPASNAGNSGNKTNFGGKDFRKGMRNNNNNRKSQSEPQKPVEAQPDEPEEVW